MAKGLYNSEDFMSLFFGMLGGAGLGFTLGLCANSFLTPIVSSLLSNLPLIPHLVFLPTFTAPFILASFAAVGLVAGYWFVSETIMELEQPDTSKNKTYSNNSLDNYSNSNYTNDNRTKYYSNTTFTFGDSSGNNRCNETFDFRPVQATAYFSRTATATTVTPKFENSNFDNKRTSQPDPLFSSNRTDFSSFKSYQSTAEASNSVKATSQTVNFSNNSTSGSF